MPFAAFGGCLASYWSGDAQSKRWQLQPSYKQSWHCIAVNIGVPGAGRQYRAAGAVAQAGRAVEIPFSQDLLLVVYLVFFEQQ